MKRLFLTTICLVAMATAQFAQPATARTVTTNAARDTASESTPEVRQKTFQKVWEIVRDKFFDPNFNGVDWNKVHERYAPLVGSVKSDSELYQLLGRMLGELHTSHLEILPPDVLAWMAAPPVVTGLGLRNIEGQVTVSRVLPGSSAAQQGLRPGYVLQRVDGAELKDLDDTRIKLAGPANTKVRLVVIDEHNESREVTLERLPLTADQGINHGKIGALSMYALLEATRLEGGFGYLRFSTFVPVLNTKIHAAIESMHDAPGLIIDLRGNAGGDDSVALNMANHLCDKPTVLMITRQRKGDLNNYRAHPVENPYPGPLVILVDEDSRSQSEQFTAGMQELGRAYVIGKKTAGSDMDGDLAKLPTGAWLIYAVGQTRTPKGVVIEGRGVIPNLEVSLTRAELLKGNDEQLSAAIQYLKQKGKATLEIPLENVVVRFP